MLKCNTITVERGNATVRKNSLTEDQVTELSEIFQQLGDPNRVRIIWNCLERPVSAGDVARRLGLSEGLASHHLRMLSATRMLRSERRGKQTFYAAANARIASLLADMAHHVNGEDQTDS